MFQLHLCIGHEDVQCRKHEPCQGKGYEAYHELADRGEQGKVFDVLHHRAHGFGEGQRRSLLRRHNPQIRNNGWYTVRSIIALRDIREL